MEFTKPRVAIYYFVVPQTGYRNDGPPIQANVALRKILNGKRTISDLTADIRDDSGNVVHLWPVNNPKDFGNFDLNLLVDHGEDAIGVPLDWKIQSPSAYWVSDAHLGYEYRLNRAKQFDYVFCCQPQFMAQFERDGIPKEKLFLLPHAFEPLVYKPHAILKKWDWSFIGHLNSPKRIDLLDRMCKEFENWYVGWRMPQTPGFNVLDDVSLKFSQSKVVLNDCIGDDLNMRTFEALGSRSCLLTEAISPIASFFESGTHLLTYTNQNDAIEKMRYLLTNEPLRDRLAENGYKEAISKHTYEHRMLEILEIVTGWEPQIKGEKHDLVSSGVALEK